MAGRLDFDRSNSICRVAGDAIEFPSLHTHHFEPHFTMTKRMDSARQLLELFAGMYGGILTPTQMLSKPRESAMFCERVRQRWEVAFSDKVIESALREAAAIVEA